MVKTDFIAPTLDTVCGWYGIHPKFAHAVLATFVGAGYDTSINDIHKLLARYELYRIQLEYAFSTNGRGRNLVKLLNDWGVSTEQDGQAPKSFLDIGCAYGGFLIAFAGRGYNATGIELNELYGRLGRLNLEASGCPATLRMGDFLSDDILPAEQKFDLITCNDVIEHVSDPEGCLRKICRMLKPGGTAYVASPNKLSITNVREDVHFQRFGLTLLDYFRARAAFAMYSGLPNYEVTDFYEPEWYVNTARSAGAQAEIVYDNSQTMAADAPREIAMLYSAFAEWTRDGSKKLDPLMRWEITRELANYSVRLFQAYSDHVRLNSIDEVAKKWIDPLTRLLIRMPPEVAAPNRLAYAVSQQADTQSAAPTNTAKAVDLQPARIESKTPSGNVKTPPGNGKGSLHVVLDTLQRITPGPLRSAVRTYYLNWFYYRIYPEKSPAASVDLSIPPTLRAVCDWYHIHPQFADAVLETFIGADYDRDIDGVPKLLERYEAFRIHLDYALSANVRGVDLAKQLLRWRVPLDGPGPKSYLDIGSAYCGFLIHFASRGYDVAGIEIDEKFGRLGRLNLEVSGCPADFRMGDFLDNGTIPVERKYDLITCNDVIEHVSDPAACLRKICRMLKPGGMAYIACPNKLAMLNVRSDAHFQRFGLTLLDYFRAHAAYTMYTDSSFYRVTDFYEPEWYVNTARSAGAEAEIVYDSAVPEPDVPGEIAMLYAAFSEWARDGSKKLDPLMRHEITREFAQYSARMFQAYNEHVAHNSVDQFAKKWIYSPTQLLVRMP